MLLACGGARQRPHAPRAGAAHEPAFGITEDNAQLLAAPVALAASSDDDTAARAAFTLARAELSALHPEYVRLLIDWAALQPDPHRPPDLETVQSGCARASGPCAPYHGVRDELAAIASQQRAGGGFEVVIQIYGTPSWAAQRPSGCERAGARPFARAPSATGLAAYRSLIHDLVELGERQGVALHWWSPWNEPNDPAFLGPQRSACSRSAPVSSPSAYARLARAMAAQLLAEGGVRKLVLGELNAYRAPSSDRTTISEFINGLPADVLCLADVWSVHSYAARPPFAATPDAVAELEQALAMRGGCPLNAPIWVTETGSGAAHPGDSWTATSSEESASCAALSQQLLNWSVDSRVRAVFQYSFRDDPAFPVGLVDAQLLGLHRVYRLWLAWRQALTANAPPPSTQSVCG